MEYRGSLKKAFVLTCLIWGMSAPIMAGSLTASLLVTATVVNRAQSAATNNCTINMEALPNLNGLQKPSELGPKISCAKPLQIEGPQSHGPVIMTQSGSANHLMFNTIWF